MREAQEEDDVDVISQQAIGFSLLHPSTAGHGSFACLNCVDIIALDKQEVSYIFARVSGLRLDGKQAIGGEGGVI